MHPVLADMKLHALSIHIFLVHFQSSKESSLRIDTLQQNLSNSTAALNQINLMVTKDADNRGLTLLTASSESLSANQRPALVVTSLQQLLRYCEEEMKEVRQRAMNCGKELEDVKNEYSDYKVKASEEYRTKWVSITVIIVFIKYWLKLPDLVKLH